MKRIPTLTVASALAAALALAGCSAGGEQTTRSAAEPATPTAAAGAQTGTAAAGATNGTGSGSGSEEPITEEHNDDDVMFAQTMIPHHQQAVDMSRTLLAKDDVPAQVGAFAQEVIDAQGPEIERMNAMLDAWGQEPGTEPGGTTDHGSTGHGSGSGMMGEEDLQALEDAQGAEAARLYLEQMTAHHRGAIDMARAEVSGGSNPQAVELAQEIVDAQEAEISRMDTMLKELGQS